jgi:predicted tellurium resistance membrane protein TerC
MAGFFVMGIYFGVLPLVMAKTIFKDVYQRLGPVRYSVFIVLVLLALSLPIKMGLRWAFNIKYIIAIPEFFFNI